MPESLRLRIARTLAGNDWPSPVTAPETTTTTGTAQPVTTEQDRFFPEMSSKRTAVYRDMEEIDATMPEGSRALDVLADNAVNAERGSSRYFVVVYRPGAEVLKGTQKLIENLLQRTMLREKAYPIARETIKYGDNFLQVVVSGEERIERLMYMPPASMRRNEDEFGLLKTGREKGEWAYEQYEPDTTKFIAGFLPWQIEHLRWNRSGESRYGVPLLNAARPAWKKLQAMEEALVINWLTRAFARLCFELDVTGKSEKEAQVYIQQFMQHLTTKNLSATAKGISRLIVAKDLAIGNAYGIQGGKAVPSLNKISVLDTANSGLINISPLEYWRNKFISATGVPKAHLGLEEDVNAKSTLEWQDARFVRSVQRIQSVMSECIGHVISLELALHGIEPKSVPFEIRWPSPAISDDLTRSQTLKNNADAGKVLNHMGLLDPEWLFTNVLGQTSQEYLDYSPQAAPKAPAAAGKAGGGDDK